MTEEELIASVRARCGKVSIAMGELDDADITREGNWILKKIAERITVKKIRSITSEANEREYDVADETLRVQKVYPPGSIDENKLSDPDAYGHISSQNIVGSEYYWPSEYLIRMMRKIRGRTKIKGTFNFATRKLAIDPYPETTGDKYWYISVEKNQWTLLNVPEDFEDIATTDVRSQGLTIIALKRSTLGGIQREGGFVDYPTHRLKKFTDEYRDEFYEDLILKAKLYNI